MLLPCKCTAKLALEMKMPPVTEYARNGDVKIAY